MKFKVKTITEIQDDDLHTAMIDCYEYGTLSGFSLSNEDDPGYATFFVSVNSLRGEIPAILKHAIEKASYNYKEDENIFLEINYSSL